MITNDLLTNLKGVWHLWLLGQVLHFVLDLALSQDGRLKLQQSFHSWQYCHYFNFENVQHKNVYAQCNVCQTNIKLYICYTGFGRGYLSLNLERGFRGTLS